MISPTQSIPVMTISVINATGTGGPIDLTGVSAATFGRSLQDVLTDGQIIWYHRYYKGQLDAGFEWCWGQYTASGETLTRNVLLSSETNNAPVDWTAADQVIAVSSSPEFFSQFGVLWGNMHPHQGIFVFSTGQSQNHRLSLLQGSPLTTADFEGIECWSKVAAGTGSFAWRTIDPTEQYDDQPDGDLVRFSGYPRSQSYDGGTTWFQTAQFGMECAKILRAVSGRRIWYVHHSANGAGFRNATDGWLYADSGNCGHDLATRISDAKDAIDARATTLGLPPQGITSPHLGIFHHGASDAGSTPEGQYATDCLDWVYNMEQSAFWGVCDPDICKYLFIEPGLLYDESTHWNGFGLLAENSPERVQVFSSKDLQAYDLLGHATGESIIQSAQWIMGNLISPGPWQNPRVGVQTKPNFKTAAEMFTEDGVPANYWDDDGDHTGAPAVKHFSVDTTNNKFRLDKTSTWFLGSPNFPLSGDWGDYNSGYVNRAMLRVGRDGRNFIWRFGTADDHRLIITSGMGTDQTDYWEWDLVSEQDVGTPGTTTLALYVGRGLHDGEDFFTHLPAAIRSSEAYADGTSTTYDGADKGKRIKAVFDDTGKLVRPAANEAWSQPHAETVQISDTTTTTNLYQINSSNNERMAMRFEVIGKRTDDSSTEIFQATVIANGYQGTGNPAIQGTPEITEHDGGGNITLSVDAVNVSGSKVYRLRCTLGNDTEVWVLTTIPKFMQIPDAA